MPLPGYCKQLLSVAGTIVTPEGSSLASRSWKQPDVNAELLHQVHCRILAHEYFEPVIWHILTSSSFVLLL